MVTWTTAQWPSTTRQPRLPVPRRDRLRSSTSGADGLGTRQRLPQSWRGSSALPRGSGSSVVRDTRRGCGGEAQRAKRQPLVRPLPDHGAGSGGGKAGNTPLLLCLPKASRRRSAIRRVLRGKTDAALVALLELRNDLGHELRSLDEAKAAAIEAGKAPLARLLGR